MSTAPTAGLREAAEQHLRALAGPAAQLREDQWTAVEALVAQRRRVVVVQRTGWGKSAVYWVATALRRAAGGGPTLVVSPLLALMRDQVAAAERSGLRAVTINSANLEEWPAVEARLAADDVDVLLVSPERLNSAGFRARVLPHLAPRLGLLVVDEAHCISDWGHDFRPDYRRIATVLQGLPEGTPVLATTATANARVSADVAAQLGEDTLTLRGPLEREGLALAVVPTPDVATAYAWIAEAVAAQPGSGIVYTLTVAETTRLAEFLTARGHSVAAYSSATEPAERERLERALLEGSLRALVATSSLGMGYDHPRLSFVLHLGAPSSPVAYYQHVGRAGRALDGAVGVLLPTAADERIWAYFDSTAFPPEPVVRRVLDVLAAAPAPMSLPVLEVESGLRRGRLEALLKVLDVDGAVERAEGGWRATGAPWRYDAERIAGVAAARRAEQDVMRSYLCGARCLMRTLREALDDPQAQDCGRCSVCTGSLPPPGASPQPGSVAAALAHLRSQVTVLEPRRMWPSGAPRRGRIPLDQRAEPGRALALAEDPAWGEAVTAALRADEPVPQEVLDGLVRTLARWGWPAGRPTWVTWVPSRRHGALLRDLAERLGALGRLQVVPVLAADPDGPRQDAAATSTAAATAALARLSLAAPVPQGPVLLLDDTSRSGWTLAVAAALLREAGSGSVHPLVLHKQV
ncbi:ATP-dependent DNA helicase RecQ [Quadrisphaera sp. DSM 44207]|uniref:RecQ family ATP-dependent DNA helicase n=1 Tax=Quadrisphaera sp. DSM 44207 TaxID=1881057 RepID=UPI00088EE6E2|nr:DEAD/DEAH box helicase [Quadrisphaera sp. DSM 44207]SDQ37017.1 ATP-dependent DNA helicase RecQ [Quadrisphaera sp. DSM 44207]